jgi:hypothetical protein
MLPIESYHRAFGILVLWTFSSGCPGVFPTLRIDSIEGDGSRDEAIGRTSGAAAGGCPSARAGEPGLARRRDSLAEGAEEAGQRRVEALWLLQIRHVTRFLENFPADVRNPVVIGLDRDRCRFVVPAGDDKGRNGDIG